MSPGTKAGIAAATAGAFTAGVLISIGVFLKVRDLQTPEYRRTIEGQIEHTAAAEADRYINASFGLTQERIAAIGRLANVLGSV